MKKLIFSRASLFFALAILLLLYIKEAAIDSPPITFIFSQTKNSQDVFTGSLLIKSTGHICDENCTAIHPLIHRRLRSILLYYQQHDNASKINIKIFIRCFSNIFCPRITTAVYSFLKHNKLA